MQLIATKHRLGMCMSVCFWYLMPEGHSSQLLNPVQQQSGAQVFGLSAFVSNTLIYVFGLSHTPGKMYLVSSCVGQTACLS